MRAGILAVCLLAFPAAAHEMMPGGPSYPTACCNERDCRALSDDEVRITPHGYEFIATGQIIPFTATPFRNFDESGPTVSPDGGFHACFYTNGHIRSFRVGGQERPCFWAPSGF